MFEKELQLIGLASKLLNNVPSLGRPQRSYHEPNQDQRAVAVRTQALLSVRALSGSVTVMIGTRGTGKTTLEHRMAEFFGRKTYCISPEQKPPHWIEPLQFDAIETITPWSTIIFDDLPAYASNRDYNNQLVESLERLIPMCRHKKHLHLIFGSQSAAQADKYILDCDLAFLKPLGLLMADVERPFIAKLYRDYVNPFFDNKTDDFIHRHAWMISRLYKGPISISKVTNVSVVTKDGIVGVDESTPTESSDNNTDVSSFDV